VATFAPALAVNFVEDVAKMVQKKLSWRNVSVEIADLGKNMITRKRTGPIRHPDCDYGGVGPVGREYFADPATGARALTAFN